MARVTSSEVLDVINILDPDLTNIEPFITTANVYVTQVLSEEITNDDLLKEIERWLAAHYISIRDRRPIMEQMGDVRDQYDSKIGFGLKNTPYGQQALTLDYTGTLARLDDGKGKRISMEYVGTKREDVLDV